MVARRRSHRRPRLRAGLTLVQGAGRRCGRLVGSSRRRRHEGKRGGGRGPRRAALGPRDPINDEGSSVLGRGQAADCGSHSFSAALMALNLAERPVCGTSSFGLALTCFFRASFSTAC